MLSNTKPVNYYSHTVAPSVVHGNNKALWSVVCAVTFFSFGAFLGQSLAGGNVWAAGDQLLIQPRTITHPSLRTDLQLRALPNENGRSGASHQQPIGRRSALVTATAAGLLSQTGMSGAVQGLTPGRIPGFGPIDERGYRRYARPEGKSGGHGVGWSEIPSYSFDLPASFEEIAVSIADLGGTEIDARFKSTEVGDLTVVVAPVLRFRDVGYNARVNMESLGTPEVMIQGFAPEIVGTVLEEEDVISTKVEEKDGLTYYSYEVRPRTLVSMTATGNRLFLIVARANPRQWSKHKADLRTVIDSFRVPPVL